jgi:hypothetical protein
LGVTRNASETIRVTAVQAQTGSKADESDLVVNTLAIDEAQGAARVTLRKKYSFSSFNRR